MSKPGDQTPSKGPDENLPDPDFDQTLPEGAFDKTLPEGWIDPAPSDEGATMVGDDPAPADEGATMVGDEPAPADDGATMVGFEADAASEDDFGKTLPEGALTQLEDDDFASKTIMMDDVTISEERTLSEDDFGKTLPEGALDQLAGDDFADKTMMIDPIEADPQSTLAEDDFDKTLPEGAFNAPPDDGATMVADFSGATNEEDDFGKTLQVDAFGKTLATDGTIAPEEDFDGKTIVGADSAVEGNVPSAAGTIADPNLQRSDDAVSNSRATSTGGKTSIEGTQVFGSDQVDGIDKDSLNVATRSISGLKYGMIPRVDFKLVKQLGEGGMGVVYVAKQQSLGREVVFKTLKPLAESQASKLKASGTMNSVMKHRTDMFLSEAVVTADLFHPNIVPIYELARAPDGSLFYTMKWVRGDGWHNRLKQMTLEENLEVLMKVSDAMGFAHSRHIVNRDLKPENVMLGGYGETIVLDWGLALPFGEGKGRLPIATTAGLGSGTPAYMPPELITGPLARIGPACDIYLLGAMLFEVVTGVPPHDFSSRASGGTVSAGAKMAEIRRVVVDNVIRETEHTGELIDIARKAMATKPEDRYRTVADFQNAIRDYMKHAASRTLADRAKELTVVAAPVTTEAKPTADAPSVGYTNYQNALALYNESLREWTGNNEAREGLTDTQLNFAKLALTKGDFDLGLSVLDTNADSHSETRTLLVKAREERESRVRRMKVLKWTAIALLVGFAGVSAFAAKGQFDLTAATRKKEEAEKQA
ncbi:MAG: serine/threonine protein kinase, partial [Planctomycetaceae bacterium]|nr:serine/threonine protein kinase [Planctomycetaceae bacterium]